MKRTLIALSLGLAVAAGASAQDTPVPLAVGAEAPDFEIPVATQSGVLEEPIRLTDYRGQTVVLAFFFRARSGG